MTVVKKNVPDVIKKDVGERIRGVRGRLTQGKFAEILGINQTTICKYEAGRVPEAFILKKIADFGGVSMDWILHGGRPAGHLYYKEEGRGPPAREHAPETYDSARPAEIQEFLFAEVFRMVLNYEAKHKLRHDPLHTARLLVKVYNECVTSLERPTELLCEKYDALIP